MKTARLLLALLLPLALAGVTLLAFDRARAATPPYPTSDPIQNVAPGTSVWGNVVTVTTSTTTYFLVLDGDSHRACLPYGSVVVGTALAEASIILTENDGVTIGDPAGDAECSCTYLSVTSPCGCHVVAKGPFVLEVDRRVVHASPGANSGLCSAAVDAAYRIGGVAARPRCASSLDCTNAGVTGGTCLSLCTTRGQTGCYWESELETSCAFVAGRALTSSGKVAVEVQR